MVNGRPTNYFQATRGIRQGYPDSPFLYILMADAFSIKLDAEKKVATVPGIRIVKGIEPINHSLFVDDSLLMGRASIIISKAFSKILQDLCSITRVLINNKKECDIWLEHR